MIIQTRNFADPFKNCDDIVGDIFRQSTSLSVFALTHGRATNLFQNVISSGIILCDDKDLYGKMKIPTF